MKRTKWRGVVERDGGTLIQHNMVNIRTNAGMLIGGVTVHRSVYFDTKKEAQSWAETVVGVNLEAGRRVGRVRLESCEIEVEGGD